MRGNRGKSRSSSSVPNESKKSPTTSTHKNSPDDWSSSAPKSEASTENKSQRIDIKPLGKLPDGFLNEQKFYIQLVVLLVLQLITVPIVNLLMKSDNVEKCIETVERKLYPRQEKFFELDKKFTVTENKLSELEKLLHENYFTGLLDKEWEKRKVLLTKELEKKHAILNDIVDNELKNVYEKITDVFQQITTHKKEFDDKLNEREVLLKGNMEVTLEEEIKNVTQKMKNKHSNLTKIVEDIEYRLAEVKEQMESFSVDMRSAMETIYKEVKGKQSEMETKIKLNEGTLEIVNERMYCFSNKTKVLRRETERLDASSSKLNRKMKSNEKKIIEINRQLYFNSKKVNDQIKHLENNTEERLDGVDGMFNVTNERLDGVDGMFNATNERLDEVDGMFNATNERLDGVDRLFNVFTSDLYDISLYIVVLLFAVVFAVFLAAYEKLVSKQLRTVDSAAPAEVTKGHMLESGRNKRLKKEDTFSSALIEKLSRKNKEKGVGIISFNSSTQENHKRSFEAIDIPSSLPVQAYVILKLDDLMLVQPYTKMFIFVDFNERNIILENSETEIGDIRRRTTEVLLEVGCDVFVVYYRDKNSKFLPKENLYSTSLYSIEKQTVLSRLRSRGRVFSVYDTFHPQQIQILNTA
ncbi:myosin heavy chain, clone 203-like isoform X2 [Magallana gigas]|uniref:myosin heavy chain, clone 203-like isoform X2 n=1 Tax=Magallana gigas TaxID=29159 RepID=UPI003342AC00